MLEVKIIKSSTLHELQELPAYEVIIALPMIDVDLAIRASEVMRRRAKYPGLLLLIEDDMRLGFIMVTNLVYAKTKSQYFAYVAQDAFAGYFWLDSAMKTIKKTGAGLLAFNDGRFFGTLAVFGLADRRFISKVYGKFIFYPHYKSHFADTELSVIATYTNNMIFNPNSLLLEVDYEKHLHGNNEEDHKLYIQRAGTGFDGRVQSFTPSLENN